jgi:hypothetical protein
MVSVAIDPRETAPADTKDVSSAQIVKEVPALTKTEFRPRVEAPSSRIAPVKPLEPLLRKNGCPCALKSEEFLRTRRPPVVPMTPIIAVVSFSMSTFSNVSSET